MNCLQLAQKPAVTHAVKGFKVRTETTNKVAKLYVTATGENADYPAGPEVLAMVVPSENEASDFQATVEELKPAQNADMPSPASVQISVYRKAGHQVFMNTKCVAQSQMVATA